MDWLSQNWIWVLLAAGAIWMFARGRHGGMGMMGGGCFGGHGGHGDHAGHEGSRRTQGARYGGAPAVFSNR